MRASLLGRHTNGCHMYYVHEHSWRMGKYRKQRSAAAVVKKTETEAPAVGNESSV